MGSHLLADGKFQSDKYPTCPPGKVPLSVEDPMAQDLLWAYAQRRRSIDAEFSEDLETALRTAGYEPRSRLVRTNGVLTVDPGTEEVIPAEVFDSRADDERDERILQGSKSPEEKADPAVPEIRNWHGDTATGGGV